MTRTKDRLVLTRVDVRNGKPTGGTQFLDEMRLTPRRPSETHRLPAAPSRPPAHDRA
jgi:hypothetical protein